MTCREIATLLPRFFDAELDSRQMRAVALHTSRCNPCEQELRALESVQELINSTISQRVDTMDLSSFWSSVEANLPPSKVSWTQRWQRWWDDASPSWDLRIPALAAVATIAALGFYFLTQNQRPGAVPSAPHVVLAESNEASIDSLEAEADSVAVMSDPETHTTMLWVSDDYLIGDVSK